MLNYNRLHFLGVEMFIREFKGYMSFIEEYIDRSEKEFQIQFDSKNIIQFKETNPEYYDQLVDHYSERWFEVKLYYPHNFRASFLVQTYAMIEYELRKICDHYQYVQHTDFGVSDFKGNSDLEKCKLFLQKAGRVDFGKLQEDWNYINLMRKLRNRLVHHQSKISRSDNDWKIIYDLIKNNKDLIEFKETINSTDKETQENHYLSDRYNFTIIIKNKILNERFLEVVERFFRELLQNKLQYD